MTGNLLGSSAAGVIGDFFGWRGVLTVLGLLVIVASVAVWIGFRRGGVSSPTRGVDFSTLKHGYRTILKNPNARVCFTAVFIEGLCVLGLFPFVAAFLFELGETRASIPGVVIAAFAVGGLLYTMSVSRLLPRIGVKGLMIGGAAAVALQFVAIAFGPRWEIQAVCFLIMGWGFYCLHGSLQVFSSDLAPEARASALSLHAFCFFMGQAVGPIVYGFALVTRRQVADVDFECHRDPGAWNDRRAAAYSEAREARRHLGRRCLENSAAPAIRRNTLIGHPQVLGVIVRPARTRRWECRRADTNSRRCAASAA